MTTKNTIDASDFYFALFYLSGVIALVGSFIVDELLGSGILFFLSLLLFLYSGYISKVLK
jgi:hypothetical protein